MLLCDMTKTSWENKSKMADLWLSCLRGLWPPVGFEAAHTQELSHDQQRGQTVIVHLPHVFILII